MDLGCGTGIPFDKFLEEHGCKVTGIDFCRKHVREARINVPSARFLYGDFSSTDLSVEFDAVVSFYAMFHIPREEHQGLFLKIRRILRPGGLVLVSLGTSGEESEEDFCGARMAWSSLSTDTYERLLVQLGFEVVVSGYEGNPGDPEYHYWVMARRLKQQSPSPSSTDTAK